MIGENLTHQLRPSSANCTLSAPNGAIKHERYNLVTPYTSTFLIGYFFIQKKITISPTHLFVARKQRHESTKFGKRMAPDVRS